MEGPANSDSRTQHLTVLPHSGQAGKVEQLKQEFKQEAEQRPLPSAPIALPPPPVARDEAAAASSGSPLNVPQKLIEGKVIAVLQTVFDPEIPVNIYELGLVYGIDVDPATYAVRVRMTLTSPGCPVAGSLPGEVETKIETIPEVPSAKVELVWEPQWSKDRMSEAALLELGLL